MIQKDTKSINQATEKTKRTNFIAQSLDHLLLDNRYTYSMNWFKFNWESDATLIEYNVCIVERSRLSVFDVTNYILAAT